MTEVATTDQTGVARSADGTIVEPGAASTQTTSQETTSTQTGSTDGKTLLNQSEPKAPAEGEKAKAAEGAPEKYADYKVPENFSLDTEVVSRANDLFKGMGLSQENAQSLIDLYIKETADAQGRPYAAYQEMVNKWGNETANHPDLRGKVGAGKEVNTTIAKALTSLGDPALEREFREVMDLTGAGNHPAFVRTMFKFAQRLTEGSHVAGNGPSEAGQSSSGRVGQPNAAKALWPNLPSNSG